MHLELFFSIPAFECGWGVPRVAGPPRKKGPAQHPVEKNRCEPIEDIVELWLLGCWLP